mgnify:CR=1 FL=1
MGELIPQEHGGAINRFVKGESGNPNGRAKKWVSTLKENGYKKSEIVDAIEVLMSMDKGELEEVVKDETNTILELTIAKALLKGLEKGTLYNLETLTTRVHGQPKQEIDQTITVTSFNISLNLNGDIPEKPST